MLTGCSSASGGQAANPNPSPAATSSKSPKAQADACQFTVTDPALALVGTQGQLAMEVTAAAWCPDTPITSRVYLTIEHKQGWIDWRTVSTSSYTRSTIIAGPGHDAGLRNHARTIYDDCDRYPADAEVRVKAGGYVIFADHKRIFEEQVISATECARNKIAD